MRCLNVKQILGFSWWWVGTGSLIPSALEGWYHLQYKEILVWAEVFGNFYQGQAISF